MISSFLSKHTLITDGAMGTYYAQLTGDDYGFCELANLTNPTLVQKIHREYINAGAKLIRTNTFSANSFTLKQPCQEIKKLLQKAVENAVTAAAEEEIFIAANIGPIPVGNIENQDIEEGLILDEYRQIIDTFLTAGIRIFNFETFSSFDFLAKSIEYLKSQSEDSFTIIQFTLNPDGLTRKGIKVGRLIGQSKQMDSIDAIGFNCGVGPTHLYRILEQCDLRGYTVAALPNAGYPELINERTIFPHNPQYFASKIGLIKKLGVKILGGCCGTTPAHIRAITGRLLLQGPEVIPPAKFVSQPITILKKDDNPFQRKIDCGEFVIAVELDPPFDANVEKIINGAKLYREQEVDLITVADSPLAKARADAIAIAAKIKREIGVETMPHLCCRDRNLNGIKAALLGAHIEGIRNILAVTGDPLSQTEKEGIKGVFNLNSIELMGLIADMNANLFEAEPFLIGGALNLNAYNKELEIKRMLKKVEKGGTFFLTQPIFDPEVISFLRQLETGPEVKILAGIMPLVSYKNALFINNEIPGISIPENYMDRFEPAMDRETAEQVGIELAVEISCQIRKYVDGFYFITPFNRVEMVSEIIKRLR